VPRRPSSRPFAFLNKRAKGARIDRSEVLWKVVSLGCGALSGIAVEQAFALAWRAAARDDPPSNPADRNRSLRDAVIWGAAVGVGAGIARVMANRGAATVWEAAAGEAPPGVET
jgi:hypothetical protein